MKRVFLLLVLLNSFYGFTQHTAHTQKEAQTKVYEYVLNHMNQLNKGYNFDTIYVKIFFKKHLELDSVSYYKVNRKVQHDLEKMPQIKEVPFALDSVVKQNFRFFKHNFFDDGKSTVDSYGFIIPFSKSIIAEGLKQKEKYPPKTDVSYNINPGSKFQIKINKLHFFDSFSVDQMNPIKSTLNHLSSEAIALTSNPDNFYIVFRIINTSYFRFYDEEPLTFLEYKLFYIKDYKQHQVAYGRQSIENRKITISDSSVYSTYDILENTYFPETDEEGNEMDNPYDLKGLTFNFDIQFE